MTYPTTILGQIKSGYGGRDCELSLEERLRHLYIIGKSGTGKSTLLFNIAVQDIAAGVGLAIFDPHGDLAQELLAHIPRSRTRDVVYINLADLDFPLAWNPLQVTAGLTPATIAYNLTLACKHIWRESWGPRMEYVLGNCFFALSEAGESLLSLPTLLSDSAFRKQLAQKVSDPKVRHFFQVEFEGFDSRQRAEIVSPIQNKIGQLLTHEALRNIFACRTSKVDFRFMMDTGRILIVNLAKGRVGEEPANLFGSILVSTLSTLALSRADLPKEERQPFMLLVDEFQSFSTESFANSLSEVRKYGLGLTLAHQYTAQVSPKVSQAIFGNVQSKVLFAVGASDAEDLKLETRPYPHTLLLGLRQGEALFCGDNGESEQLETPEAIDTHLLQHHRTGNNIARTNRAAMIIAESRKRFTRGRVEVRRVVEKVLFGQRKTAVIYSKL